MDDDWFENPLKHWQRVAIVALVCFFGIIAFILFIIAKFFKVI